MAREIRRRPNEGCDPLIAFNGWVFIVFSDRNREWRWQLLAANGNIVAESAETYHSKPAVMEAARRVRDNAGRARIR